MIIVIGVAGSGKSTQSRLIAGYTGWIWLSMGQILRDKINDDLAAVMNTGKLLKDEQVQELLLGALTDNKNKDIVLDGFPRRPAQAIWLLKSANGLGINIDAVVHLNAHNNVVLQRLLDRGRQDDIPKAIQERFKEYETDIKPVINIMHEHNIPVLEINGEQSPEQVHQDVKMALNSQGIKL